jgi:hypothetical protein
MLSHWNRTNAISQAEHLLTNTMQAQQMKLSKQYLIDQGYDHLDLPNIHSLAREYQKITLQSGFSDNPESITGWDLHDD